MITKQRTLFYFVGETAYKSLEEAQKADLLLLMPEDVTGGSEGMNISRQYIADWILENSSAIVDILTTTPTSRLKSRKLHGGTRKPRKAKVAPEGTAP